MTTGKFHVVIEIVMVEIVMAEIVMVEIVMVEIEGCALGLN
jgi:hypothetical protein